MGFKENVTKLFDKVSPFFERLAQNKYLQAISSSMMGALGPLLLGSISLLLMVLPIPGLSDFIQSSGASAILGAVFSYTTNALSLYVAFLMGVNVVKNFMPSDSGLMAGCISLMSFLVMTPIGANAEGATHIPFEWLGAQGVFSAIIIGIFVGRIYVFIKEKGWIIRMPESVPPTVSRVFESLIPTFVVGFVVIVVATLFKQTEFGSMHKFIYTIIQTPLQNLGGTVWALVLFSIVQQMLWFFGIHGTNVIMPLMIPIYAVLDNQNMNAVSAGLTPPNIIGMQFFNVITWGGLALGLVLLMLRSKSKQYKELGKMAVIPALFGITEPVIFGTPLVLNFDFAFPFIFNNSIVIIISYFLIKSGIVARFAGTASIFGLPIGLYAATQGQVTIVILHLVIQLVLSPLLWYPWFKRAERRAVAQENGEQNA